MGQYIKYFEDENTFAEWLNFGEKAEGPDGAPSASVAYVGSIDAIFYDNSDVSQYELLFQPQNSEIDSTAETIYFDVKTGGMWLDVYHNGELVGEYGPGEDSNYDYSVDANMTPLTVQEVFTGQWFKDNNNEKGEFVQSWDRSVTHKPDPYAEPVKLTIHAWYTSDGQSPTRLGNGPLTGATRVYYEDETLGTDVDILNDIYIQSKRAWYQFSAQGEYNVYFEFETDNQVVGDYFIYSEATRIDIYTNYPDLGAQTNFVFNGPLMQSTIEEVNIGEGMQSVSMAAFMGANSLNYIYVEGDVLPAVSGQFFGLPSNGTFEADSRDAENFQNWVNALPSDWEILPEPQTLNSLSATTVFITTQANQTVAVPNGGGFNDNEYCGVFYNGVNILNDVSGGYYTFAEAGEHTLVYVRSVDGDFDLQGWLQSPDMISCSIASDNNQAWGFHGNENGYTFSGCTSLTGVTFDENCYLIGNNGVATANTTFVGCTALTSITCYSAVSPANNTGDFETITSNTGTLHIPSGADYSTWATALGNNWTVVDDL